jgi:hypothetical protein
MRLVWMVLFCARHPLAVALRAIAEAMSKIAPGDFLRHFVRECRPPQPAAAEPLSLHECRLEHPLRLASIRGALRRAQSSRETLPVRGASIELHIAVVPALNRRATAAPLFLLAGGPGKAPRRCTSYAARSPASIAIMTSCWWTNAAPDTPHRSCATTRMTGRRRTTMPALRRRRVACLAQVRRQGTFLYQQRGGGRSRSRYAGSRLPAHRSCMARPTARAWRSSTCGAIPRPLMR